MQQWQLQAHLMINHINNKKHNEFYLDRLTISELLFDKRRLKENKIVDKLWR